MSGNLDGKVEELISTMLSLGKAISRIEPTSFEEHASTMLQYSALQYIKENQGVTVGSISGNLGLSKSSATQLVERLSRGNLITRTSDQKDRRSKHITITEKGLEKLNIIKKQTSEKMKRILKKISDEDIDQLLKIQKKLLTNLKQT